jgi:molybdopterin synthase sulfur carrier subunit
MEVKIILFGYLADIAGGKNLVVNGVKDTDELQEKLKHLYPALADSIYLIAVDKEIVQQNTTLGENHIVALLPPFSGG